MKKKVIILLFVIFGSISLQSQVQDTIWLDKGWEKTTKELSKYFRLQEYNEDNKRFYVKDYYSNGELQMSGRYISLEPEVKDGIFKYYFPDKTVEISYSENIMLRQIEWNKEGEIVKDEGRELIKTVKYYEGEPVYEMKLIDKTPQFDGGIDALMKYISKSVTYPKKAKKKGVEGRVLVQFVVNKRGKVKQAFIYESVDELLDKEALRVVKDMPDWQPGEQDGKKVNVKMMLPIKFSL